MNDKVIKLIDEFNYGGHLVWVDDFSGAYARGKKLDEALLKLPKELQQYCNWAGIELDVANIELQIVQRKESCLQICDADSDVLFDSEKGRLTPSEYARLKALALKSAKDFLDMYNSVPSKEGTTLSKRATFYGEIPTTAKEMYLHTKNVNAYYFGEIGIEADNDGDIYSCRLRAFNLLEQQKDFLQNAVYVDEAEEQWTLKKVLRRFIWHDRIHAKAMYRMAVRTFGEKNVVNVFNFNI